MLLGENEEVIVDKDKLKIYSVFKYVAQILPERCDNTEDATNKINQGKTAIRKIVCSLWTGKLTSKTKKSSLIHT
jgi:hypothetical protein